jgi:ATP-dependent helicase/nuclease subunit A
LNHEETKANQSYILNLPNNTLKNIGIVIHNCLSNLSKICLNNWLEKNLEQQRDIWQKQLIQLGTIDNLTENINVIEKTVTTTLHDPNGQWILNKNHQDAQNEYQITLIENTEIRHLIIDRTFVDNGIRWIIDYKTSTFNDNDLNIKDFLSHQFQLHHNQLETYAKAMRYLDNRPIRLGLYFPMFAGWYEWS